MHINTINHVIISMCLWNQLENLWNLWACNFGFFFATLVSWYRGIHSLSCTNILELIIVQSLQCSCESFFIIFGCTETSPANLLLSFDSVSVLKHQQIIQFRWGKKSLTRLQVAKVWEFFFSWKKMLTTRKRNFFSCETHRQEDSFDIDIDS